MEPNFGNIEVTCQTNECENQGITMEVLVNLDAPAVICGACGQWIIAPPEGPAPE